MLHLRKSLISNIKITDIEIIKTTLSNKTKEIKWSDITDLFFGKTSLELKITSRNKKIKAHLHLVDIDNLVNILLVKAGKSRSEIGVPN